MQGAFAKLVAILDGRLEDERDQVRGFLAHLGWRGLGERTYERDGRLEPFRVGAVERLRDGAGDERVKERRVRASAEGRCR